jgi:hypothetical protein
LDAADRAYLAGRVDGAGAGDEPALRDVPVTDLVHDAEGEHQACGRAADGVVQAELHLVRGEARLPGNDADCRVGGLADRRVEHDGDGHRLAQSLDPHLDGLARLVLLLGLQQ